MGAVITIIIVSLVFLVMSIFLFCGKGSWFIAGFNTASAEEKASYDKKKLCRAMGVLCLVMFLCLWVMAFLGYKVETGAMAESVMDTFVIVFAVTVITSVIVVIWYMNTRCKK